ncbi:MAG: EAL domain-containing protein [Massilia sp.]
MPERFLTSALPQHEAAELYRLMVVGIENVAVFLMDPAGVITVWNKGAQQMKGYTATEAIGQFLGLLYTDEDRAAGRPEHNLHVAAEKGTYSEETWRKHKDGHLFWAHIVLTALRDADQRLLGFSKVTMDLTRHKMLEQCNREKAEIDLILRAADSGTWKWMPDSGRVEISRHLMQLLGYESVTRTLAFDRWLDFVHRDDRVRFRELLHGVREQPALAPLETELRFRARGGHYHWFFLRANWQQEAEGEPHNLIGVCVAVDNLKSSEQQQQRLMAQLSHERARFSSVLEQLPSGVILADVPSGTISYQNRAVAELLGSDPDNEHSYRDYGRYHFVDADGHPLPVDQLPLARTVNNPHAVRTEEMLFERRDGRQAHLTVTTAAIFDTDGIARLAVAVLHDVSLLKRAELAAASEKERALVTLDAITDGVITADRHGRITSLNPAAVRMTGLDQSEALGREVQDVLTFDEDGGVAAVADALARCLKERRVADGLNHLTIQSRTGQHYAVDCAAAPVRLDDGTLIGAVLVFHDVTESKRLLRRLGFEASHDALTNLVNRREFELRLKRALDRAHHSEGVNAALLYMDLDQFKIVNDTCGHTAGDELLRLLASAYSEHVRERDTLARIGGDEFGLIVEHCDLEEALAVAQKILDASRAFRYPCKGRLFQVGVSIGVTPIDRTTASVEEAMRRADHACYIAKERGRNRIFVHYHGNLDFAQRRNDMHWVTRLTHAFQNEQLQLYCQPIMPLAPGEEQAHYEILLRLRNGRAGAIKPGIFLPAAERYDVILKIDRWVLKRTLDWLAAHADQAGPHDLYSINLSRRSLADVSFHQYAADLIDASRVPASTLCFEITENGAIADMNKTIAFIEAMSARGCRFSLDDFGTGMTSFTYLKQLPVDYIKIDGSFIQMMSSSEVDFEMVRFTNDISHMMGRQTIAEYVSDDAILASLKAIGVDFAQGYCIGKPRPLAGPAGP